MSSITLEQVHEDLMDIKKELKRLSSIVDFDLSDSFKKDVQEARNEDLESYTDHKEVLKEFS